MRRVFLGARHTHKAAHRLVARRFVASPRLWHDGTVSYRVSECQNRSWRRQSSTHAAVPELQPVRVGLDTKAAFTHTSTTSKPLVSRKVLDEEAIGPNTQAAPLPIIPSSLYGKWRSLSLNNERLCIESEISSSGADRERLVDQPDNENDLILWTILLRYKCQRMGLGGASLIWDGVNTRRAVREVDGIVADAFWQIILNNAIHDQAFLESVWLYAQWLKASHGLTVPRLYMTVVASLIVQRRSQEALLWHLRLCPSFAPGQYAYTKLLKRFITNPDEEVQKALRSLYIAGSYRSLYDDLIPHLYELGKSTLARAWRSLLIQHGDTATMPASGPFVRFLAAYYTDQELVESEQMIFESETETRNEPVEEEFNRHRDLNSKDHPLSELLNRVHGETFGIQEKSYNDIVGARWFASSWISLDFAIAAVHALGVQDIGPLSLQSIALREDSAEGIHRRINQLHSLEIGFGKSRYCYAIRYLARTGDYESLQDLLHSDLHPDVFQSEKLQADVVHSCTLRGEWKNYHLIGLVNLASTSEAVYRHFNELLLACIADSNNRMILQVMRDMRNRDVGVYPSTSDRLSTFAFNSLKTSRANEEDHLDYLIALCRELARTRFPPPARVWEELLKQLGRTGRVDELENLALELIRLYKSWQGGEGATMILHKDDVPACLRTGSRYRHFQIIPRDLPISHPEHPLVKNLFHTKTLKRIVRWGFSHELRNMAAIISDRAQRSRPSDFWVARGVRLLRILKDNGLAVHPKKDVEKAVLLRLTDLFGPTFGRIRGLEEGKDANRLTLPEVKQLFEDAWGAEFLGSVEELERYIEEKGNARLEEVADWKARKIWKSYERSDQMQRRPAM